MEIEALLDTGFDGDVVIPAGLLASGLDPAGHERWTLADGTPVTAAYYEGTIQVGELGTFPVFMTVLGDELLIGLGVARHLTITLDHAARIIIDV